MFVRGWEVEEMRKVGKRIETFCKMNVLGNGILGGLKETMYGKHLGHNSCSISDNYYYCQILFS